MKKLNRLIVLVSMVLSSCGGEPEPIASIPGFDVGSIVRMEVWYQVRLHVHGLRHQELVNLEPKEIRSKSILARVGDRLTRLKTKLEPLGLPQPWVILRLEDNQGRKLLITAAFDQMQIAGFAVDIDRRFLNTVMVWVNGTQFFRAGDEEFPPFDNSSGGFDWSAFGDTIP